jgi:hypothetical protein
MRKKLKRFRRSESSCVPPFPSFLCYSFLSKMALAFSFLSCIPCSLYNVAMPRPYLQEFHEKTLLTGPACIGFTCACQDCNNRILVLNPSEEWEAEYFCSESCETKSLNTCYDCRKGPEECECLSEELHSWIDYKLDEDYDW